MRFLPLPSAPLLLQEAPRLSRPGLPAQMSVNSITRAQQERSQECGRRAPTPRASKLQLQSPLKPPQSTRLARTHSRLRMARKRKNRTHLKGAHKDEKDVRPLARRRQLRNPRVLTPSRPSIAQDKTPKSFVIKVRNLPRAEGGCELMLPLVHPQSGQVGASVTQLVRDIRKIMEPGTATRLRVSPSSRWPPRYCQSAHASCVPQGTSVCPPARLPHHGTSTVSRI